jgi:hypothetical protein
MSDDGPITCPNCGLISFNEDDIKNKYCRDCGYHSALPGAPPGVPGASAKWRQPSPIMELRAICMSLEGHYSNWKDGITDSIKFEMRFEQHIKDIREIYGHIEKTGRADSW